MSGDTLVKFAGYGIVGLGILHLIVLGCDAVSHAPAWFAGSLWTWEHWGPVAGQSRALVLEGFAFWSTIGSFAVPMIILGCLLISMSRRHIPVPPYVGSGLLIWGAASALLMPPSGFPIFAVIVGLLCIGLWSSSAGDPP